MTINDPIADMLTRIRNAGMARQPETSMPTSKILVAVAKILQQEGYIGGFHVEERRPVSVLRIELKYGSNRAHAIREVKRVSKPGLRVYAEQGRDSHGPERTWDFDREHVARRTVWARSSSSRYWRRGSLYGLVRTLPSQTTGEDHVTYR